MSSSAVENPADTTFHDPFNADPEALAAAAAVDEDVEEAGLDISKLELTVSIPQSDENLLSLETASERLGAQVLEVLDSRFKGKLSGVRHMDEHDLIL